MKPRFLVISAGLIILALLATVLVWTLLQDIFSMQQERKIETEHALTTDSTTVGHESQ